MVTGYITSCSQSSCVSHRRRNLSSSRSAITWYHGNNRETACKRGNFAFFSSEILSHILYKVPAEQLRNVCSVSEDWRKLITSRLFLKGLVNHNHAELVVVKSLRDLPPPVGNGNAAFINILSFYIPDEDFNQWDADLEIPFVPDGESVEMARPCNGLICLFGHTRPIICNPSTREFRQLEQYPVPAGMHQQPMMVLSKVADGFGYNSVIDSYKLVRIYNLFKRRGDGRLDLHGPVTEVYDSRSREWTTIDVLHDIAAHVCPGSPGVFYRGYFHFVAAPPQYPGSGALLCFNVGNEEEDARHIELPQRNMEKNYVLCTLTDLLAFVVFPSVSSMGHLMEIFVIEVYGVNNVWTRTHILDLSLAGHISAVHVMKDNFALVDRNGQPALLNLGNAELTEEVFPFHGRPFVWNAGTFMENLIALDDVIVPPGDA